MRIALLAVAAAVGTFAVPAVAHPDGHSEYVPQRRPIAELAQDSVVKLVTQAKLSASWTKLKPLKSDIRTKNGAQQWVVTFRNPSERLRAKRTLYVIMDADGSFVSANHRLL